MSRSGESDKKEAESGGGAGARQGSRSIGSNTDCAGGEPYYRYRDGGGVCLYVHNKWTRIDYSCSDISRVLTIFRVNPCFCILLGF